METKEKITLTEEAKDKTEDKKENKPESKEETKVSADKKDLKKKETALESTDDDLTDDTDNLFKHRESVALTPENAVFIKSEGGLVSLKLIHTDGEDEFFERVILRRSFPVSSPDEFISVREPDTRAKGRGEEIGMIRNINIFDSETVKLLNDDLAIRYFSPEILKITSAKEKFGYHYWEAETTAGKVSFVMNAPFNNIRVLEDGRIYISDMDGCCFIITDPQKLDRQSYRYIEVYI